MTEPMTKARNTGVTPMNSDSRAPKMSRREHVAAELVGAERVALGAGRAQAAQRHAAVGIVRRDLGREDRHQHEQQDHDQRAPTATGSRRKRRHTVAQ